MLPFWFFGGENGSTPHWVAAPLELLDEPVATPAATSGTLTRSAATTAKAFLPPTDPPSETAWNRLPN
jgi:hypothetical protein